MTIQFETIAPVFRWAARLSSAALLVMVVAFYVNLGSGSPFTGPPKGTAQLTAFLLVTIGLVVGWLWDVVGALIVLGGMFVFSAMELVANRGLPTGAFAYFWIPGVLWLISAALSERTR